jgi:glutamate-1-semialdehyde 2,1-aminomutase
MICDRIEAIESVRFTNSGSEAGMLAVKAARHITGRPYVVKAVGAYHGCYEDLEAGLYGRGDIEGRALAVPFNSLASFERVMARHGSKVAALIVEPVLVTGRVVAPEPGFLKELEWLAHRHGALTILDDCLMLRLAMGGSAERFGLEPDLVVLGKFLGGGMPFGAFGGSRKIMSIFDPTRRGAVFHGGSFNGNLIGCAAGLVTLRELTQERIAFMDAACARIRSALAECAGELGIGIILSGIGSVLGIAFTADPARHEDDPSALGLASLFHLACANEGLMIGPGGIITVSTVHDEAAISFAVDALRAALGRIAELAASL